MGEVELKLLPCPFCGSAEVGPDSDDGLHDYEKLIERLQILTQKTNFPLTMNEAAEAISTLLKERDALKHDLERSMARESELLNRT
jgi:hypothetical protein